MSEKHNTPSLLHVINHGRSSSPIDYRTFLTELKKACTLSDSPDHQSIILFIEFYGFSRFYGSGMDMYERDTVLIEKIGDKLTDQLCDDDLIARVGEYQYIIARSSVHNDALQELAKQIIYEFSEPCMVNGQMFYIYTSIGISLYPLEGDDTYRLVKIAQAKMEQAKENGRNLIGTVQESTGFLNRRQTELKKALPAAMENGEITFVYQAQYSHKDKRYSGAEVLARWNHPVYGDIPPAVFIPLAEQSGMIASLSVHAIIAASKVFQRLEEESIENFSLSVNISPLFLITNHFYQTLEFLVKEYALNRYQLHFEITEEIFLKHTDYLVDILHKIKQLGIQIELDDFGTGYTSVKQLAELPLDIVKIDQSFVSNIDKDPAKKDLLRAIAEMTKVFGIEVIAEGVESIEEDRILKSISSVTVQGYLYAKPESCEALIKRIKYDNR